jgi:hypothetical protein
VQVQERKRRFLNAYAGGDRKTVLTLIDPET